MEHGSLLTHADCHGCKEDTSRGFAELRKELGVRNSWLDVAGAK